MSTFEVTGPGDLAHWDPTIGKVRDAILTAHLAGPNFAPWCGAKEAEAQLHAPTRDEVEKVAEFACEAVRYGRLIDFGFWPNDAIKLGGIRGGPLWSRGFIGMPFIEPWVLYHRWEGGSCAYLINPYGDQPTGNSFEACELSPVIARGRGYLTIADRGLFQFPTTPFTDWNKYGAAVNPGTHRYLPGADQMINNTGKDGSGTPEGAAAGNVGDPIMLALMILNTRNVERATIHAPEKLNRARIKNHKPPIPPYQSVQSAPYVTAIMRRGRERGEDQGGTHASPIPHIRIGHPREYASGRTIFIRDTLVNASDAARSEFLNRSHYAVRGMNGGRA
jgi:hypothetical protein